MAKGVLKIWQFSLNRQLPDHQLMDHECHFHVNCWARLLDTHRYTDVQNVLCSVLEFIKVSLLQVDFAFLARVH